MWQSGPLPEGALASPETIWNTLSYEQWLQFVLIPRARKIITERGAFPERSFTGTGAVRNFDGRDEAEALTILLGELDRLVER